MGPIVQMADISNMGMVTYYNPLVMYRQQQPGGEQQQPAQHVQHHGQAQQAQQHAAPISPDGGQQYWYGYTHGHPLTMHHQPGGGPQQYLDNTELPSGWTHNHGHPYSQPQYQHQQVGYQQPQQHHQHQQQPAQMNGVTDWSGDEASTSVGAGQSSPPITVSGSEISNPGTPSTPPNSTVNANSNTNNADTVNSTPMRPTLIRSPYEWMKKTSYQSQPHPGKTRTKDKYRVVYTDHQRLELEKEFHYNRYITMRRKSELATTLLLSERQVKIWFQNRRAKERKMAKKREELEAKEAKTIEGMPNAMAALTLTGMGGMLGGLVHNPGSPPMGMGLPAHTLSLPHGAPAVHGHVGHAHQLSHQQTVLGI